MENASKALIIAGSVLIAIVLIAVAVRTLNSTQGTTDQYEETMQSTEIATFNSKFTAYAGSGKSAAEVKALANLVIAHNATNKQHQVSLGGNTTAADITSAVANLSGSYTVSITEYENGYVKAITFS